MIVNISDTVNPRDPQKRTWRQINNATEHFIDLGAFVEVKYNKCRLYVVFRGRDCDGTPMYWLSFDKDATGPDDKCSWSGGHPEDGLTVLPAPEIRDDD